MKFIYKIKQLISASPAEIKLFFEQVVFKGIYTPEVRSKKKDIYKGSITNIKLNGKPVEYIGRYLNVPKTSKDIPYGPCRFKCWINLRKFSENPEGIYINVEGDSLESLKGEKQVGNEVSTLIRRKKPDVQDIKTPQELIRDIWQKFVDIQEKLIRQKCQPIYIDIDSIEIDNNKIIAFVDDSNEEQEIDLIFRDKLGVKQYDLSANHLLVPQTVWEEASNETLSEICNRLQALYVELDPTPSILASINYSQSELRTDQLTLHDIQELDKSLSSGEFVEGYISDIASFICNDIKVDITAIKKHLFGDHCVTFKRTKEDGTVVLFNRIEYYNSFIPWNEYIHYNQLIGLNCTGYTLSFVINDFLAADKLKDLYWGCLSKDGKAFEFKQAYNDDNPLPEDFIDVINQNIAVFINDASLYCSQEDITVNLVFRYNIDNNRIIERKYRELAIAISGREGYSFNENLGSLGIDFNWRKDNLSEIIADLEKEVPFIRIKAYNDDVSQHKLKCRSKIQIANFESIKHVLHELYKNITVENDSINQIINIKLPYFDLGAYEELRLNLEQNLRNLKITGASLHFIEKNKDDIIVSMHYNAESRMQDIRDRIMDMKRADFGVRYNEEEMVFGRLINSFFDDDRIRLVFDVNVENEETKEQIKEAFKLGLFNTVIPILVGDLEKITRLKRTFTMATTGANLVNPRLSNFIFDSSQATPIKDIEYILNEDGHEYRELTDHLLNPYINESQKQAILKAIWSEDLAVIQGPPGTGKSTAIAELIWQLVRNGLQQGKKKERILLTSETNLAVDNAMSRIVNSFTNLVKPVRLGGEEKLESEGLQFSLALMERWVNEGDECLISTTIDEETDTIVKSELILRNWLDNILNRSFGSTREDNQIIQRWRKFLSNPDLETRKCVYNRYLEEVNVIGATCSSIGDFKSGKGFTSFFHDYCKILGLPKVNPRKRIKFTTVIQDESSKSTPAELVLPFVYGERSVVIGDHRQLPPMLDREEFEDIFDYAHRSAKTDSEKLEISNLQSFVELHFEEMEISHFQRLYENIHPSLKGTFNLQYRMHPAINSVIEQFYTEDGGLKCGLITPRDMGVDDPDFNNPASRYHGIDISGLINPDTHVLFINSESPEMIDGTSRVNYGEVQVIDKLLTKFEESPSFLKFLSNFNKDADKQIGIISFYSRQVRQIRNVARQHMSLPIRTCTVDRFQGMERNIIIVSMVRSHVIQSSQGQMPNTQRYPEFGYPMQRSLGFAQSPNRLNVALSRAKRLLIIIGNERLFSSHPIYFRLFKAIRENKTNIIVNQNDL